MTRLPVLLLAAALLLFSCGKSKKKMSGQDTVDVKDFIEFFDPITLPLTITDSVLKQKDNDSTMISDTVFAQFAADTIFNSLYGKHKPKIYALGRFKNGDDAETYLLVKAKGNTSAVYVLAYTPENKYSASMVLLSNANNSKEVNKVSIDTKYTFNLVDQYKDADGSQNEFTQVYAYNNAGLFMMILQDGLPKGTLMPILNPIDTLPMKHKFSGNYGKDSRNFITIRDGKTEKDLLFFINMDKGATSNCQAELKGEAVFVTKDSAVYTTKSDPCAIGFRFGAKSIRITEATICGNKRPADCSFNAYYLKQKAAVAEKKSEHKKENK